MNFSVNIVPYTVEILYAKMSCEETMKLFVQGLVSEKIKFGNLYYKYT